MKTKPKIFNILLNFVIKSRDTVPLIPGIGSDLCCHQKRGRSASADSQFLHNKVTVYIFLCTHKKSIVQRFRKTGFGFLSDKLISGLFSAGDS